MHYAFIIMPSNALIIYCLGFTESVTKIIMPCNYITCVWSSLFITWRANYLFVEKKDIVRHITDCKLWVVLRKRCIKAPKKMHYSQLVILFRFTKQNQLDITLTLPLIYRATAAPCPLPPPGAWTDKTTHMTSNKPIRIFCWFVQPTCGLSPTHLRLAPTSVYTHLLRAAAIPTWLAPTSVYTHLWAFAPSAVKMMKMFSWFAGAFSICVYMCLHVFSEVAARWALGLLCRVLHNCQKYKLK